MTLALLALLGRSRAETFGATYQPPADRVLAAEWLGALKAPAAVPALLAMCSDPDGGVRRSAVAALGQVGDEHAVATLARIAADPTEQQVDGVTTFSSNEKAFWHYGPMPARGRYDVRAVARQSVARLSPIYTDPPPIDVALATIQLSLELASDPQGLVRFDRDGSGAHADRAYMASAAYTVASRRFYRCYKAIETIASARFRIGGNRALTHVLGCGVENLELDAARALAQSTRRAEVLALVRQTLDRSDLTPLTLSACLGILVEQDPAGARPLAQRVFTRMATADGHAWERFPSITSPALRQVLQKEGMPKVLALRDAQTDPARRTALEELAWCVTNGLPPKDELYDLSDTTTLSSAQRDLVVNLFLDAVNQPQERAADDSRWQAFKAAYQLGRLRVPAAVPALLRLVALRSSESYGTFRGVASSRTAAAGWALTQIADPSCVAALREIARQQSSDRQSTYPMSTAALLAYGRLAREQAIDDLAAILNQAGEDRFSSVARNMGIYDLPRRQEWVPDGKEAFPTFNSSQEAAAFALSEIGGPRAREVLLAYLASDSPKQRLTSGIIQAIYHVAPEKLDEWSRRTLETKPEWGHNSLHATAVAVRLGFFPGQSAALASAILKDPAHPLHWSVVYLLRSHSFHDQTVTAALIHLLDHPAPPSSDGDHSSPLDRRLEILDAIGCQGGEEAVATLLKVAVHEPIR